MNDLITSSPNLLPIRTVKAKKQLSPNTLAGKRKDGGQRQQKLNPRQKKFISFYREGKSARKAALLAGYSESLANNASTILLENPLVDAEIKKLSQQSAKLRAISPEMIYDEVSKIASANMLDYIDIDEETGKISVNLAKVSRDQGAAIQEFYFDTNGNPKIRLGDKLSANALLGKFKRMGITSGEISTDECGPITIQQIDAIVQRITVNQTINNNVQNNSFPGAGEVKALPSPVIE